MLEKYIEIKKFNKMSKLWPINGEEKLSQKIENL